MNMRKLGQKLPFSHHTQTCIQCKVTGEMMNENNQPLFLPTGFVVSERALDRIIDKEDGQGI
jgi:macrophage erythroblast attacher